jgi:hypothetical protein
MIFLSFLLLSFFTPAHLSGTSMRVRYISFWMRIIFNSWELLVPGRPIRALASDGFTAARFKSGSVSVVDRVAMHIDIANNFCNVAKTFSHVANRRACNIQRRILRVRVASMLRTRLRATSNIMSLSSLLPHVATILRPCCDCWGIQGNLSPSKRQG